MTRSTMMLCLAFVACAPATPTDDVFFVHSAGVDMPVWVRGDATSGVVVLFLAGGPGAPAMFYEELTAFRSLEASALVAFWDQRVSGGTSGNATSDSLTLEQYTKDLDGVVGVIEQRYEHPRIVLLGHSWGGLVGNAYLTDSTRQARITGWVDVDGLHHYDKALALARDWAMGQLRAQIDAGQDVAKSTQSLAWLEAHPRVRCSELFQAAAIVASLEPAVPGGSGSLWLNLLSPFSGLATLSNSTRAQTEVTTDDSPLCTAAKTDLTAQLPRITIPSLVVWGDRDRVVPPALADEAFAQLGASVKSRVLLENAGHTSFADQPAAFVDAVEKAIDAWVR